MSKRSVDELHRFLISGSRELVNVKFFPGTDRGLTSDQLAAAAHELLESIMANPVNRPPLSGRKSMTLKATLA